MEWKSVKKGNKPEEGAESPLQVENTNRNSWLGPCTCTIKNREPCTLLIDKRDFTSMHHDDCFWVTCGRRKVCLLQEADSFVISHKNPLVDVILDQYGYCTLRSRTNQAERLGAFAGI